MAVKFRTNVANASSGDDSSGAKSTVSLSGFEVTAGELVIASIIGRAPVSNVTHNVTSNFSASWNLLISAAAAGQADVHVWYARPDATSNGSISVSVGGASQTGARRLSVQTFTNFDTTNPINSDSITSGANVFTTTLTRSISSTQSGAYRWLVGANGFFIDSGITCGANNVIVNKTFFAGQLNGGLIRRTNGDESSGNFALTISNVSTGGFWSFGGFAIEPSVGGVTQEVNPSVGSDTTTGSTLTSETTVNVTLGTTACSESGSTLTSGTTSEVALAGGLETTVSSTLTEAVDSSPATSVGSNTSVGSSLTSEVSVEESTSVGTETTVGTASAVPEVTVDSAPSVGGEPTVGQVVSLETTIELTPSVGGETTVGNVAAVEPAIGAATGLDTVEGQVVSIETTVEEAVVGGVASDVGSITTVDVVIDLASGVGSETTIGVATTPDVVVELALGGGLEATVGSEGTLEISVSPTEGGEPVVGYVPTIDVEISEVDVSSLVGSETTVGSEGTLEVTVELTALGGSDSTVGSSVTEDVSVTESLVGSVNDVVGSGTTVEVITDVSPAVGEETTVGSEGTLEVSVSIDVSGGSETTVGSEGTPEAVVSVDVSGGSVDTGGHVVTMFAETSTPTFPASGLSDLVGGSPTVGVVISLSPQSGDNDLIVHDVHSEEVGPPVPPKVASQAGRVSDVVARLPRFATWEARQPLIEKQRLEVIAEGAPWRAPDLILRQSLDIKSNKIIDLGVYRQVINAELAQQAEDEDALMAIIQAL